MVNVENFELLRTIYFDMLNKNFSKKEIETKMKNVFSTLDIKEAEISLFKQIYFGETIQKTQITTSSDPCSRSSYYSRGDC